MLGLGDTVGFVNAVKFEAGLSTRSLGLEDAFAWPLPREPAMIVAVELTPPKRADGLMAGEGFVSSVGEDSASSEEEATSVDVDTSSGFAAPSSAILSCCPDRPPFLFFGPFALPLRISAKGAPSAGGSLTEAVAGFDDPPTPAGLSDLEPLGEPPFIGGPRARRPARPGLKRAASLLVGAATGG
jgi:hypothetical protein